MIFIGKISKGHNFVFFCTSSDDVHENILKCIKVKEQTQSSKEKFQRGIIP